MVVLVKKGGAFMQQKDFYQKIDDDIDQSRNIWDEYSHDEEKMSGLFSYLVDTYKDEIEGFCIELEVIQPYEKNALKAQIYRNNIKKLLDRLEGFRCNGYQNEGLMDYYLKLEHNELSLDVDFTNLRLEIGMMKKISNYEKDEIIEKLDEMEVICSCVAFKRHKWEQLREYLVWLSGKDVDIALKLLPIFFKIG